MRTYLRSDDEAKCAIIEDDGVFYRVDIPHGSARWFSRIIKQVDVSGYAEVALSPNEEHDASKIVNGIKQISGSLPGTQETVDEITRAIYRTFESYWDTMKNDFSGLES